MPALLKTISDAWTDQKIVATARESISGERFVVGKCAALWCRAKPDRTDAEFGVLVGLSAAVVQQRRRVWEVFGESLDEYPGLRWSHFNIALTWTDSPDALAWASENEATVAEMRAWRRMQTGEPLDTPATTAGDEFEIEAFRFTEPVEGERVTDDSLSTSAIAPVEHDPSEAVQRGDKPAPTIGIPAEELDRDRTHEAPAPRDTSDRAKALREARAMFRAAARLCEMGLDEGCKAIARECQIEAQQGEIELPDDRTIAALLQLGEMR